MTGASSTIAREVARILRQRQPAEWIVRLGRGPGCAHVVDLGSLEQVDALPAEVFAADRLLVCHGVLQAKQFLVQRPSEIVHSLTVNLLSTVRLLERALSVNPEVRAVVMGSESGVKGSFDGTYALAKAGLHAYVRWRELAPGQQLVCIAPP